jgi:methyl-accepting chemotaxis protein
MTGTMSDGIEGAAGALEATLDSLRGTCDAARADAADAQDGVVRVAADVAATAAAAESFATLAGGAALAAHRASVSADAALATVGGAVRVGDDIQAAVARLSDMVADLSRVSGGAATGQAAIRIHDELDALRTTAAGLSGAMHDAQTVVGQVRDATGEVVGAANEQAAASQRIGAATSGTLQAVAELNRGIARAARNAARTASGAQRFAEVSKRLRGHAGDQLATANGFVAEIRAADRRAEPREPSSASVILAIGDREIRGVLRDVSSGGASVLLDTALLPENPATLTIRVPHAASTTGVKEVGRTANRVHLSFIDRGHAQTFLTHALDRSASLAASNVARPTRHLAVAASCA